MKKKLYIPSGLSNSSQVFELYKRLAGDKLDKCDAFASKLILQGYKPERAWADALETYKCVKNEPAEL